MRSPESQKARNDCETGDEEDVHSQWVCCDPSESVTEIHLIDQLGPTVDLFRNPSYHTDVLSSIAIGFIRHIGWLNTQNTNVI